MYIKGTFTKSIFESSGYTIGLFRVHEASSEIDYLENTTVTITGYFILNKKEKYILTGEYVDHSKYGLQFNVSEFKTVMPEDTDSVIDFLSGDMFKGVGKVLATRIVDALGKDAIDKIIEDKSVLSDIKMQAKKRDMIHEVLVNHKDSTSTIIYLKELGFTNNEAIKIYNEFRENTMITVSNNIYDLIEVDGISYQMIDKLRGRVSIDDFDDRRIKASIIFVIKSLIYRNGDTYTELDEIDKYLTKLLGFSVTSLDLKLDELRYENLIVKEDYRYYLREIYDDENRIIDSIKYLSNLEKIKYSNLDKAIEDLEEKYEIKYNQDQKSAIKSAIENNLTIITGGPGTGKTTIIKAITELYQSMNKCSEEKLALLAPTGRAAKRMSEVTLIPASTIHRFLKWNKEKNEFGVDEYNKDLSELIIVDEVSMIDINLLASLFRGTLKNIKLVLVGDYYQLPSVGPGNILKDLIESDKLNVIYLEELYRQKDDSYIPVLTKQIKDNSLDSRYLESSSDYTFIKCEKYQIKDTLKTICKRLKDKEYDISKLQVMVPMYAGVNGIDNLNRELQSIFNPSGKELNLGTIIYRVGDKVLQLKNMPDENVFNGDTGKIIDIKLGHESSNSKYEITVEYDGLSVKYNPGNIHMIKHAYVISIHKSQGSEYDFVIMPICDSYSRMLYRKLIYTGITRAKRKLILLGDPTSLVSAVENNSEEDKKTNLKDKLISIFEE